MQVSFSSKTSSNPSKTPFVSPPSYPFFVTTTGLLIIMIVVMIMNVIMIIMMVIIMKIMIYFVPNRGQSGKSQIASTRSQYIFIAKTIYKVSSKKLPISLIQTDISASALWDQMNIYLKSNQINQVSNPQQRQFPAGEFTDGLIYNPPSYRSQALF